jgi:hypothetical protein
MKPPRVEAGTLLALRLYDVAYGVDLDAVERLATARAPTSRLRFRRARAKSIDYGTPPVEIALGAIELPVGDVTLLADTMARVFDFGTVSITLRIRVADRDWPDFAELVRACDTLLSVGWQGWQQQLDSVLQLIAPALDRPSSAGIEEDYLITLVRRFDRPTTADELLVSVDMAALLARETQPLSEQARRELLRHSYSYYPTDLAVLTWDHAFIMEPGDDMEVADVLETANAQLLEMRYYDEQLDAELPPMYDRVQGARRGFGSLARRSHANVARELHARVAEVTQIAERVDNALIITEDVYLARIYGAAIELFRVPIWTAAVNRKLAIMRDTYTALYDEAATARAEILEAGILLLIVFEIVMAFLRIG